MEAQAPKRITESQNERINILESLPEEMLIEVLKKVDYADFKQLILVSKPVSKAVKSLKTEILEKRTRESQMERINILESLPKNILIEVLGRVDYADLKQLIKVSRIVCEATLVAKGMHH